MHKVRTWATLTSPRAVRAAKFHHLLSLSDDGENEPRVFCLAFRPDNKIHLFPPCKKMAQLLRETVEKHWTLESDEHSPDCYTVNFKGTPFLMYSRRENAMLVKYICCLILERFKAHGWTLVACTDLSRKTDLTTWYFSKPSEEEENGHHAKAVTEPWIVCLSLSVKRKLQLINAPPELHRVLRNLVEASYEAGIEQDAHYGRDYQINLKGTPWDTEERDEIVAACELISDTFAGFGRHGYHFYGSVNLKDTADSFFFEYDPNRISENDRYMVMALDGHHILRLAKADLPIVEVVKATIDQSWPLGLDAEGQIACGRHRATRHSDGDANEDVVCWEFVLKGSPWEAPEKKIGQSRQFVTYLLDALLAHSWAAVTSLGISRSPNKKSALLFKRCQPVADLSLRHACLSPLGKRRYQLINAPGTLRRTVREEFKDVLIDERTTDHQSICEMTFSEPRWWALNSEERDSYIFIRKRMGRLLQSLTDSGWHLVASADVARQIEEDKDMGSSIHSWFLMFHDNMLDNESKDHSGKGVKKCGGEDHGGRLRRPESEEHSHRQNGAGERSKARGLHLTRQRRIVSPPARPENKAKKETRRTQSGHNLLDGPEQPQRPSRFKLTSGMKSKSAAV